ncbi:FMN-dependent NADH-azoreductase [Saliniradius amylolyticus]|uniref:FMN dependent NADH:quinone oxidoreductase n=1 Tax=Saliniradius amylolyticus TaxID=2183582 RepID=A0A2S2E1T8_9ALTE|nr:NAD(P)H-dependent oxidoreductase [Saliniradius amylolyticus]AWL11604.1 FMN-dependent NADH-azoreductase [Saliniradius amylolyticus]
MKNLLVIKTSLNGDAGNSNKLVNAFVEKLQQQRDVSVTQRNLAEDSLPHLSQAEMASWMTPVDERDAGQQELAAISDTLVNELQQHDTLVIGMPMYNFGAPSVFKAWVDRVARAGITFRYTENGPVGLVENKKVIVLAARGGQYQGTDKDTQTQYLKNFFAFIGISDVEFVYAEGLAMGEDSFEKSFSAANEKISELLGQTVA